MSNPFPGMNPYLEKHWRDVHARLVLYASDLLQPQLGGALRARVEERVVLDTPSPEANYGFYPDVRVEERSRPVRETPTQATAALAALAEPIVIERLVGSVTEGFIQIINSADGNRVVTVIEFISFSNKRPGPDRKAYRAKQKELRRARVSLVEIDLLRGGRRVLQVPEREVPRSKRTTYAACVHRGHQRRRYEYYPFPFREPLPAIRIPLRPADADAVLDIQKLVRSAYDNGAYDDLDYSEPLEPALHPEDQKWVEELLKGAGRR